MEVLVAKGFPEPEPPGRAIGGQGRETELLGVMGTTWGQGDIARERVAWAMLWWGRAPTSESQVSEDAEMLFCHLETHKFFHLESSFYCIEMDVCAHVILTSRLCHPYIKQPREPKLIHLFPTEDGSVSKLFY